MWNVAHRQPGFPGKNPRKMIRILTGFAFQIHLLLFF
ncbi:rCG31015 [Rattus norvegicus]|uniref:RCG31015 n=1 Tax=Rattus norvegicus TaxID=10116 RepID=A6ISL5_RAT|nr:rCG31015 [Rattus norvegicus]